MNMKKVSFVDQSNHHRGSSTISTTATTAASMEEIQIDNNNDNANSFTTPSTSGSAHDHDGSVNNSSSIIHHHSHGNRHRSVHHRSRCRHGGTLKDRIKHKALSTTSAGNTSNIKEGNDDGDGEHGPMASPAPARRESLLVAASALASLSGSGGPTNTTTTNDAIIQSCCNLPGEAAATTISHHAVKGGDNNNDNSSNTAIIKSCYDAIAPVIAANTNTTSHLTLAPMAQPPSLSNRSTNGVVGVGGGVGKNNSITHHHHHRHYRMATMQAFQESHHPNYHQARIHPPPPSSSSSSTIPDIMKAKQLMRQLIQASTMATMMNGSMRMPLPSSSSSSSSQSWEQQQQQHQQLLQHEEGISTTTTASSTSSTPPMARSHYPHHHHHQQQQQHVSLTFPQKLMKILSTNSYSDIISWLPHGKGFLLLQKRRFAEEVLPKFFKQSKFASFTRKLNRWGFVRVTRGPEMGAYYHKYFIQGNFLLCTRMTCQSTTTTDKKSSSTAGTASPKQENSAVAASTAAAAAANKEEEECAPSSPSSHASSSNSSSASSTSSTSKASSMVVAAAAGVKSSSSKGPFTPSFNQRLPSILDLGNTNQSQPQQAQGRDRCLSVELQKVLQSTITSTYLSSLSTSSQEPPPGTTTGVNDHDLRPRMMQAGSSRGGGGGGGGWSYAGSASTGTGNDHPPRMNQSALLQQQHHHRHHSRGNGPYHPPQWTTTTSPRLLPTVTNQQQRFILQNLLGINTTTSRNHQHIMAKALNALKSSHNDDTTEIMLTKASSTYNNNSSNNNNNNIIRQQQHPLEHRQHTTMNQLLSSPSLMRQIRPTTTNAINDEIHTEIMQARRSHQLGNGGESTNTTGSDKAGATSTSALELSSLQNDHPAMALLKSITDTQEPGPTNHLHHHQALDCIRKENTPTTNEEDLRNVTSLAHYLQQRRLSAKAEARLRLMRAQSNGHPESKRQRCDNPTGTTPPSVSEGSGEGGGESRQEAKVDVEVGVIDTASSMMDTASLLVNELELEARKRHGGIDLPPTPQPLFVAIAPNNALRSPQPRPGPVRRASAA